MILTVDTGATKTLLAVFDDGGNPRNEFRFPTPQDQNQYRQALLAAIEQRYDLAEIESVAVAVPGIVNPNGKVLWCGNLPWTDFELAKMLNDHLRRPVFVQNDANLAGLAEANAISPPPRLCLYLTISTGIGSGIILNGRLTEELSGSEAGHMLLNQHGGRVTWESFASGGAVYRHFDRYAYQISDPADWLIIAENLAAGLLALLPALQPDSLVLGGSIGEHFDRFKEALKGILEKELPPHIKKPQLQGARHGQEAVLYGCYYYARHRSTAD